ncbi:hypothetical protein EYC80_008168 [Monilinia laxa]|uniref:Protein kinase domain-containing protein n=1 Tax=Monilinia laxa TaxID=61186 RepID=A0A5N6JTQ2_MONLA|nr:hypothetical protein EYC80_008168 [Monilinia laxa]
MMDTTEDSDKRWEELESRAISNRSQAYIETGQPMSKAHAEWLASRGDKRLKDNIVKIQLKDANGNAIHNLKEKSPVLDQFSSTKPWRPTSSSSDGNRLEPSNAWLEPTTAKGLTQDEVLSKAYKRPHRHLNDLLATRPDIPSDTTILGLLHMAESSSKQADTFIDNLERPDLALQEWVKVNIIINGTIPQHDDSSSLKRDLGLLTRYRVVKKWLEDRHEKFEGVKETIKGDNHRYDIEPSSKSQMDWPSKENGGTSSDYEKDRRKKRDGTESNKEDKAARLTSNGASISQSSKDNSTHITHSQSPSSSQRLSDDYTISYPCHIRKCPEYQSGFSSQQALMRHYVNAHGEAYHLCDYSSCQSQIGTATSSGSKFRFLRSDFRASKAEYKAHLRNFHKEDIGLSSELSSEEINSLAMCKIEAEWWRCQSCLSKVLVENDGYTCTNCKAICETARIAARKTRFGFGGLIGSEKVTPETIGAIARQAPKSDNLDTTNTLGIPPGDPRLVVEGFENCSLYETEQCINIEYTHTEYLSNKYVPLTTIKQLGHGSLGVVDAVRFNESGDGALIARKIIRIPTFSRKKLLPLIQQEVAVLRGLTHQHIVRVVSTYETTKAPRQFGILIFPAGDEDLGHFLDRVSESDFPEKEIRLLSGWQCCLASAVAYIHSQNIRHKDIKPNNIICKGDQIYLTDFGSAHQFSAGNTSSTDGPLVGITKMYSAPEVIADDRRGRPADIYSLGCVFAEMTTVADGERVEEFHEYRSQKIPDEPDRMTYVYHATAHMIAPWFAELGDSWTASLLQEMLAVDPKRRPTAKNLFETLLMHYDQPNCLCQHALSV